MPISYVTAASLDGTQNGSAPIYGARAWVNFNGTGTVAIRASGNVSSITDNGTGDYTVNFTTAMPDANYSISGMARRGGVSYGCLVGINSQRSELTTTAAFIAVSNGATLEDQALITVSIIR